MFKISLFLSVFKMYLCATLLVMRVYNSLCFNLHSNFIPVYISLYQSQISFAYGYYEDQVHFSRIPYLFAHKLKQNKIQRAADIYDQSLARNLAFCLIHAQYPLQVGLNCIDTDVSTRQDSSTVHPYFSYFVSRSEQKMHSRNIYKINLEKKESKKASYTHNEIVVVLFRCTTAAVRFVDADSVVYSFYMLCAE